MKKIAIVLASFALAACATNMKNSHEAPDSVRGAASAEQLGRPVQLYSCRGQITLNEAANNDLSIQLEGVNTSYCDHLSVTDHSSGRVIREYEIKGSSYTLSKKMLEDLSDDCQVDFNVHPGYSSNGGNRFVVYIPWCAPQRSRSNQPAPSSGAKSYQLSGSHNCKLMINGNYSGSNVSDAFCEGARGNDVISYELSNKGNCKRMINGDYSNQNVSESFCR